MAIIRPALNIVRPPHAQAMAQIPIDIDLRITRPWDSGLLINQVSLPAGACQSGTVAHWVLGLTLSGAMRHHEQAGGSIDAGAGDVLLIRDFVPQRWEVIGGHPCQTVYAVFDPRPHWLPWLDWTEEQPGYSRLRLGAGHVQNSIRNALQHAEKMWRSGSADATALAYHALEEALLHCRAQIRSTTKTASDPVTTRALSLLATEPDLSLHQLAVRCGLSRSQLSLRFTRQMGLGPMAWRAQHRMAQARELLHSPYLPIKRIAFMTGFKDPLYFSTCFRRFAGCSPQAFRRQLQKGVNRPTA